MSEPQMQSPLHGLGLTARAKPVDSSAGVWANEIPHLGYISLRGQTADQTFMAAAGRALGVPLPAAPCTFVENGTLTIVWLSPDEWMIVCARADKLNLLGELEGALDTAHCQVADNSGGFTHIALQGRHAADVLSHTSVYDIASLAAGRAVGTTFGKSSVYIYRQGGGFRLILRRSFADYIWRYLERAASPYGFAVAQLPPSRGPA
jgi:sarcosine oxidase, subunit gamma